MITKRVKHLSALLLTLILCLTACVSLAATVSQDGLTATLVTDKRSYNEGERVSVSLTLDNANADDIHLTDAYYVLPDLLGGGTAPIDLNALAGGRSANLGASFTVIVPNPAGDLPQTGDSSAPMLWALLLAVSLFALSRMSRDARKRMTALILCAAMLSGMLPFGGFGAAKAESHTRTLTVSEPISLMQHETQITAVIRYEAPAEEAAAAGAPTGISGIGTAANKAYLRWKAAEGATGYEIYRSKTRTGTYTKCAETTGTGRSVTVYSGALNFFKLRSYVIKNGKRVYSPYSTVYVIYPLAVPTGLKATVADTGTITLKWNAVTNAQKYVLFYSAEKNGTYKRLVTSAARSRTMTGLPDGLKEAWFKVYAQRTDGSVTSVSNYTSPVYVRALLDAPTNISGMGTATNRAYMRWNAVAGARGYEIWRSTAANGTYTKCATTGATSRSVTFSKANAVNYVKIRAYEVVNGANVYGKFSAPYAIFPLTTPTNISSRVASNGKITISWNAVTNAQRYALFYSAEENGTYKRLVTTAARTYTMDELPGGLEKAYFKFYAQRTDSGVTSVSNYSPVVCVNGLALNAPTVRNYAINGETESLTVSLGDTLEFAGIISSDSRTTLESIGVAVTQIEDPNGGGIGESGTLEYTFFYENYLSSPSYDLSGIPSMTVGNTFGSAYGDRGQLQAGCWYSISVFAKDAKGQSLASSPEILIYVECPELPPVYNPPTISGFAINGETEIARVNKGDELAFAGMISSDANTTLSRVLITFVEVANPNISPGDVQDEVHGFEVVYYLENQLAVSSYDLSTVPTMTVGDTFGTAYEDSDSLKEGSWYSAEVTVVDAQGQGFASEQAIYVYVAKPEAAPTPTPTPTPTPVSDPVEVRCLSLFAANAPGATAIHTYDHDMAMLEKMFEKASPYGSPVQMDSGVDLSKNQVFSRIASLAAAADDNDVTILYMACHGATSYTTGTYAGAMLMSDGEYIFFSELADALDDIPGRIVTILLSCGSGASIDQPSGAGSTQMDEQAFTDAFISAIKARDRKISFNVPMEEMPATGELLKAGKFYVIASAANGENGVYVTMSSSTGEKASFHYLTQWIYHGVVEHKETTDMFYLSSINSAPTTGAMNADTNGNGEITLGEMETWLNQKSANNLFDMDGNGTPEYQMRPQVYPSGDSFPLFVRR